MIRSHSTNTNSLSWTNYLRDIIRISIEKNNYILYGCVLTKYFTYKNIRQYITSNSSKWYLSTITTAFVKAIDIAISYNSINIIRLIKIALMGMENPLLELFKF